jgi:hypothetical protein
MFDTGSYPMPVQEEDEVATLSATAASFVDDETLYADRKTMSSDVVNTTNTVLSISVAYKIDEHKPVDPDEEDINASEKEDHG